MPLHPPNWSAGLIWQLSLRSCLSQGRVSHRPRKMVCPRFVLHYGTEVALCHAGAIHSSTSLFAAPPAIYSRIRTFTLRLKVSLPLAAEIPDDLHLLLDSTEHPPHLEVCCPAQPRGQLLTQLHLLRCTET